MQMEKILEMQNISFTYGCHPVLKDINLTIEAGEAVGITGPNGSGKTTMLKLLTGQLKPQKGRIRLFGTEIDRFAERRRMGYVPQKATFFNPSFPVTVREVVISGLTAARGLLRPFTAGDYHTSDEALELVGLQDFRHHPLASLSGGQQQRAFIARALVGKPDLLIMDEPTVGMDALSRKEFYRLLKTLNRDKGITLIIVSHDMEGLHSVITQKICLYLYACTCNRGQNLFLSPENCIGYKSVLKLSRR